MALANVKNNIPWAKLVIIAEPIAINIIPLALVNNEPAQYLSAFSWGYILINDIKLINIPSWISAVVTKIIGIIRFN